MLKIVCSLAALTFFVSTSYATTCDVSRVGESFPVLNSAIASENAEILCDFYNSNIGSRKKCVLNEAAKRCERTSGPDRLMSFSDCMDMTPEILFSTVLKPGSHQEKVACDNFDRKYSSGRQNPTFARPVRANGSVGFSHSGPLKIFVIAPFKVNTVISESTQGKIDYEIEAENDEFLHIGLEAFSAYYVPATNLLVVSSGDGANCGYSYAETNGTVTSDGLTGTCLKKLKISLPDIQDVQVQSMSILDIVYAAVGLDSDLVSFLETIQDENANIDEYGIIELTKK